MEEKCEVKSNSIDAEVVKWPHEFSELESLDSSLKCGICYDYMKTAMITSCSHTYCSMCIRKFLQFKNQCPVCFEATYNCDLRNNRPLDSIISLYLMIKDKLLKALRVAVAASNGVPLSNVCEVASGCTSNESPSRTPVIPKPTGLKGFITYRSSQSVTKITSEESHTRRGLFPPSEPSSSSSTSPTSKPCSVPKMFTISRPISGTESEPRVPCPVCQVEISSKNINRHLDACLSRGSNPQPKVEKKEKEMAPLPRRLLRLLSDKDLRKLSKDYGLNSKGDRKQLMERVQRFTLLYNSEMDLENPRSMSEIVAQVHREERLEKRKGCDNPLFKKLSDRVDRYSKPEDIEKAKQDYLNENKDHFKKLIEAMKARNGGMRKTYRTLDISDDSDNESVDSGEPKNHLSEDKNSSDSLSPQPSVKVFNVSSSECSNEYPLSQQEGTDGIHTSIGGGSNDKCEPVPSTSRDFNVKSVSSEFPVKRSDSEENVEDESSKTPSWKEVGGEKLENNNFTGWTDDSSDGSIFEIPPSQKKKTQQSPISVNSGDQKSVHQSPAITEETAQTLPCIDLCENPSLNENSNTLKRRRLPKSADLQLREESIAVHRPRRNVKKLRSFTP